MRNCQIIEIKTADYDGKKKKEKYETFIIMR